MFKWSDVILQDREYFVCNLRSKEGETYVLLNIYWQLFIHLLLLYRNARNRNMIDQNAHLRMRSPKLSGETIMQYNVRLQRHVKIDVVIMCSSILCNFGLALGWLACSGS